MPRHHREQIGLLQNVRYDQPMRHVQRDASAVAALGQHVVDEAQIGRADRDFHVLLRDEALEGQPSALDLVAAAHQADHAVAQQRLRTDRCGMVEPHADRDVDLVPFQCIDRQRRRQMDDVVGDPRVRRSRRCEPRQQQAGENIRHPDREGAFRPARVEAGVARHHALDLAQHLAQRLRQFGGAWRRLHAARRPHQQFVLEHRAQPVERVAHRRLTEADAVRRLGDVTLGQQCVQRDEQIEVDGSKVHSSFIT